MLEQGFGALIHLGEVLVVGGALGVLVTIELRRRGLAWTWPALGLPAAFLFYAGGSGLAWWVASTAGYALLWGARWHARDVRDGGDIAQRARQRLTLGDALRRHLARRETRRGRWVTSAGVVVGADARGLPMTIPFGGPSGHHCLVAGATGAGKTVTKAWIAQRHIAAGSAAVVVDPKGDRLLYAALYAAASAAGRPLLVWTPDGPCAYNPYRHGSDTELADKALAGETWTEPHYLRQAQRYLGHVVRTMRAAGIAVTPASLLAHLDPDTLETTSRTVDEHQAGVVQAYLDALGQRQRRDLSGVRDRLAILAESDIAPWLEPREDTHTIDLRQAIDSRAVVYFSLQADQRPLLAQMLAAAIVGDLIAATAHYQHHPTQALVLVDEFAALAARHVVRLFGRGRSAGISVLLGTQELADLRAADSAGALQDQVLGNLAALIAHRQNVPESAELVARVAGTRPAWIRSQRVDDVDASAGSATRTRGHEYLIHPDEIKRLPVGHAVVIAPGRAVEPRIAQICWPSL